jgi:hypothetical protein
MSFSIVAAGMPSRSVPSKWNHCKQSLTDRMQLRRGALVNIVTAPPHRDPARHRSQHPAHTPCTQNQLRRPAVPAQPPPRIHQLPMQRPRVVVADAVRPAIRGSQHASMEWNRMQASRASLACTPEHYRTCCCPLPRYCRANICTGVCLCRRPLQECGQ